MIADIFTLCFTKREPVAEFVTPRLERDFPCISRLFTGPFRVFFEMAIPAISFLT